MKSELETAGPGITCFLWWFRFLVCCCGFIGSVGNVVGIYHFQQHLQCYCTSTAWLLLLFNIRDACSSHMLNDVSLLQSLYLVLILLCNMIREVPLHVDYQGDEIKIMIMMMMIIMISNGNKTECSTIQGVIGQVI